ncbi:unnamed protein product [Mesocestoides corti]|nr:unnamed protein product [Mesocestoides corti]
MKVPHHGEKGTQKRRRDLISHAPSLARDGCICKKKANLLLLAPSLPPSLPDVDPRISSHARATRARHGMSRARSRLSFRYAVCAS